MAQILILEELPDLPPPHHLRPIKCSYSHSLKPAFNAAHLSTG
ncbi:hypothetical protein [Oscillatoria sp. FACHB-1407]|nr:hypothetical protein [Oscillatoria sp. FACHB-1407]